MRQLSLHVVTLALLLASAALGGVPATALTPQQVLKQMMDGNLRYATAHRSFPHQDKQARDGLTKGQHPIAVVMGCADSRVPPEIVFDQGLGDLFTVRVAGELPDDITLGSIEYAVEHLGAHLIIVLGHEKCGAVDAAMHSAKAEGHINALIAAIRPVIKGAHEAGHDALDAAVRANVRHVVDILRHSKPLLANEVKAGHLTIVGAEYNLETGKVETFK